MAKELLTNHLGKVFSAFRQDPEQQQEFLKSCQKNDLKRAESCLSLKVDVNTLSEDGRWSGLTIAAHKGRVHLFSNGPHSSGPKNSKKALKRTQSPHFINYSSLLPTNEMSQSPT